MTKMWKVVMADDEIVILNGLKKMIHWEELDLELAGEATDGAELYRQIREKKPDIVISDIMMPEMTGLQVMHQVKEDGLESVKFIFISGYQEFAYAREALAGGAMDYLLKPVARRDLTEAIKKTQEQLEVNSAAGVFKEEKNAFSELFHDINEGRAFDTNALYELFANADIDFEDKFFVGICIGILPIEEGKAKEMSAVSYNLSRFTCLSRMSDLVRDERLGFVLKRDENCIHMIGVFDKEDRDTFYEKYIHTIKKELERDHHIELCVGIGMRTEDVSMLKNVYKTAKFAYDLYFFEEKPVIDFEDIHKDYNISFEDYQNGMEEVFRSIIAKDGSVLKNIDKQLYMIEQIHYGNQYAVKSRIMQFTGDLGMKLHNYKLLSRDFYVMQDALQAQVEAQVTFRALHDCIMKHYEELTAEIYRTERSKDAIVIEDVKKYILDHYNEDLSVKELADVACVSQNYFSAMFKKETGQNYKAYLTSIRMNEALRLLLNTDLKTYEIGEKVGYNNVRRFVDAFKQTYGMSPMDYKRKHYKD